MPNDSPLLTENEVIEAIAGFLERRGFDVFERHNTRQRGVDLKARHKFEAFELWLEAKGATSSKVGTKRFEIGFSPSQQRDHTANAVYTALRYLAWGKGGPQRVGVAVPEEHFGDLVRPLMPVLERLGVLVFLVSRNKQVRVIGDFR